jgi:sensor histidine kinase YesM
MLPLLENAFKYVNGDYRLDISLLKEGGWLVFRVDNSVNSLQPVSNGGIGLENLKRRLQLLYPAMHSFTAEKENNVFRAKLKIRLQ